MKLMLLALTLSLVVGSAAAEDSSVAKIDTVFARGFTGMPGCAVGVQLGGSTPVRRAYGLADLEHAVPITADTVFEAGSVSKQFTAAAALLLVSQGRLSLDDDARKYLPELPDYGHTITIAELIGHTSGLRDWGDIEAIAGWPRTDRVYDMDDVLHIAARQRALNFEPGTAWSYTNTGYNLLAIIVQRVSGMPFVDFTREHLFGPLGMTHTQWRDDFRRVVKDRAIAYHAAGGTYEQLMPFENTYGHGGLLTTVGDLLIWNKALQDGRLGAFVSKELQTRTLLSNGKPTIYARGLFLRNYHGATEISHDGATAGYHTWLGRYPDQHLSMAILCNSDDAIPSDYAHALFEQYFPNAKPEPTAFTTTPPAHIDGIYASERDGVPLQFTFHGDRLQTNTGLTVLGGPNGTFALRRGYGVIVATGAVLPDGRLRLDAEGDATYFDRTQTYKPTAEELAHIAGRFHNEEVPVTYQVTVASGGLDVVAEGRPGKHKLFVPAYTHAFIAGDMMLRPEYAADGSVKAIRISDDRVWNLSFERVH
jgi:CubicO group peptidase (beta-lactamase class C family)